MQTDLFKFQLRKAIFTELVKRHPDPIDFDAIRRRIALPPGVHFNAFGGAALAILQAGYAVPVGNTKSRRRVAHQAKSQRWIACDLPAIRAWLKRHEGLELPPPPEPELFGMTGEASK